MAQITIVGNLGNDPEIKSYNGKNGTFQVASFSVGETARERDKETGEWKNGDTTWYRVSLVGKSAELASSLSKGNKVVVVGDFKQNSYINKAGEQKQSLEIKAETIGIVPKTSPSHNFAQDSDFELKGW